MRADKQANSPAIFIARLLNFALAFIEEALLGEPLLGFFAACFFALARKSTCSAMISQP
jgi:hypothetical protein